MDNYESNSCEEEVKKEKILERCKNCKYCSSGKVSRGGAPWREYNICKRYPKHVEDISSFDSCGEFKVKED